MPRLDRGELDRHASQKSRRRNGKKHLWVPRCWKSNNTRSTARLRRTFWLVPRCSTFIRVCARLAPNKKKGLYDQPARTAQGAMAKSVIAVKAGSEGRSETD